MCNEQLVQCCIPSLRLIKTRKTAVKRKTLPRKPSLRINYTKISNNNLWNTYILCRYFPTYSLPLHTPPLSPNRRRLRSQYWAYLSRSQYWAYLSPSDITIFFSLWKISFVNRLHLFCTHFAGACCFFWLLEKLCCKLCFWTATNSAFRRVRALNITPACQSPGPFFPPIFWAVLFDLCYILLSDTHAWHIYILLIISDGGAAKLSGMREPIPPIK